MPEPNDIRRRFCYHRLPVDARDELILNNEELEELDRLCWLSYIADAGVHNAFKIYTGPDPDYDSIRRAQEKSEHARALVNHYLSVKMVSKSIRSSTEAAVEIADRKSSASVAMGVMVWLMSVVPTARRDEVIGDFLESVHHLKSRGGGKWQLRLLCVCKFAMYMAAAWRLRLSDLSPTKGSQTRRDSA
ncbi:MAG: hypothetical protein H6812_13655 [Phycisphaeraceae bacterium]|nr:hypothetical protein [Phycisphaerales bacterium]MCB9844284.1 hypothetical protein [Phycisphaeraceae bacterium]